MGGDDELRMRPDYPNIRMRLDFPAPPEGGVYKVVYSVIPYFTRRLDPPDAEGRRVGLTTVEVLGDRRYPVLEHIIKERHVGQLGRFEVVRRIPQQVTSPPTVYLQVNGETPGLKPVTGGVVEKPLTLSWFIGPEFNLPKSRVKFRYSSLESDDWSDWEETTSVPYFYLPKGTYEFRVQAQYDGPEGQLTSGIARFNFRVPEPLVARPSKESLQKGTTLGPRVPVPRVDLSTVYSGSKALLVGIWNFDDANFPKFPHDRIKKDISTLRDALLRNGFKVEVLAEDRVLKQHVMDAITKFVNDADENDRLFVYFSSHGFPDPVVPSNGYIATSDCKLNEASARCIQLQELRNHVDRATARKVKQFLIAVDSCFSGLGVVVKSPSESVLSKLTHSQGAYMLTAGMADQAAAIDPELKMSTFTHFLAEGLLGKANVIQDDVITLSELYVYVQYEVAKRTNAAQIPMLGRMFGSGEMLFRPPSLQQAGP